MDGGFLTAAILAASTTAPAVAGPVEYPEREAILTVRTYDGFGVSAGDLIAAQRAAAGIFREAGIVIAWVNCPSGDSTLIGSPRRCREGLGSSEVVLRIAVAPAGWADHPSSLGSAMVSRDGGLAPPLATVFGDRVSSAAHEARTNAGAVLGLVMAHEIGHVLLQSPAHARTGLMRPVWRRSELRNARPGDGRFLRTEADTMRNWIRSRKQRPDTLRETSS